MLKLEEEKFLQTLKTGLDLLKKETKTLKAGEILSGEIAFKLYDTYGFPLDLTETILEEKNLKLDSAGFDEAMAQQKATSKAASKFDVQEDNLKLFYDIRSKHGETQFIGYEKLESKQTLLAKVNTGGQVGDLGTINSIEVLDTQKPVDDLIVHYISQDNSNSFKENETYDLQVSKEARELTMRNHSATHLLQAALIEVLGPHIKQAGSRVSADSLRFDFTHPEALKKDEILQVEKLVNQKISDALQVTASLMTKDEATEKGAMALFGEKYGDTVRVLEMGQFSLELCGGTHVQNTRDIGVFAITIETSLSSGVRRIEAVTSLGAYSYLSSRSQVLQALERNLSVKSSKVVDKLETLQSDLKEKNKLIDQLKDQIQTAATKDQFNNIEKLSNDLGLVIVELKDGSPKDFRNLSDKFVDQDSESVLFLYLKEGEKMSYLLRTHKQNKKVNCSQVLKNTQDSVNGRGGGRPDMAQGSGESSQVEGFILNIKEELTRI